MIPSRKMEKIINELYHGMIQEVSPVDENVKNMKQEILELLKEEKETLECQEYERYQDKAFRVASVAEESGFVRGFKCAFQLFMECSQK